MSEPSSVPVPTPAPLRHGQATRPPARLLVVDDDSMNTDMLKTRLEAEGYSVATAPGGRAALEMLQHESFALLLLDTLMPDLDGFALLQIIKADARFNEMPVIMISGLDDLNSIARCIEAGADDYLGKPFKPVLLRARINACLEKKQLRDQERAAHAALVESQKHLAAEIAEAEKYVRSLLPEPLIGEIKTEWRFIVSTTLGGDSFGYHWLDDDNFAMYLLDVCGHGVGAALLSISAMNALRSQALPNTDFKNPGAVLMGLNEAFQMDRQNNMYFTIWYGVFNRSTRKITFARGGHPPAILLTGDSAETARPMELKAPGMVIGSMPGIPYRTQTASVGAYAQLFLFSDGVYEIKRQDNGAMWDFTDFVTCMCQPMKNGVSEIDVVLAEARKLQGLDAFDDDFSMVKFVLPAASA
jgi:sigma-B regulation protein RsbU (phosphoserine phosphatase)